MVLNSKFPIPTFRDYLRSLQNFRHIREEWNSKTPLQKWCYLYGMGKLSGKMIGVTTFEDDQNLTWYSYMQYSYYAVSSILAIYTIAYFLLQGQFLKGLPCTCMMVGPMYGVSFNQFTYFFSILLHFFYIIWINIDGFYLESTISMFGIVKTTI